MSHALVIVALDDFKGSIEDVVAEQMAPFEENVFFEDGSRWDWYVIGGRMSGKFCGSDIIKVSAIDFVEFEKYRREKLAQNWTDSQKDNDSKWREYIYGVKEKEPREEFIERSLKESPGITAYAFLRNLQWHEGERMGWFGGTAKTECELDGKEAVGKCLHKDEKTGARIISWNEPHEKWAKNYHKRFIDQLPKETTLVCVDYHV